MVSVVSPGINRRKERHHIAWRLFLLSVTLLTIFDKQKGEDEKL